MKEDTKVKLANNDTLRCPVCGNKKFDIHSKEKQINGATKQAWVAVCDDCGFVLKFSKPIEAKDSIL